MARENTMKKAQNLSEIHQSCEPRPLRSDELADFFIETAPARDPIVSRRDEVRELLVNKQKAKILLAGHGGCGKSTELVKLGEEVRRDFLVVNLSVAQECNLFHVPVEDLLVVVMERLVATCGEDPTLAQGLGAAEKALKEVHRWFTTELEIQEDTLAAGVEAAVGVDSSQNWLTKALGILVQAKADIRRAGTRLHRVTRENPHKLSALAERCNILVRAVQQALAPSKRQLLIVLEDLDKVNLNDARAIFIEQPTILAGLDASIICTVAIFLLHSPNREAIDRYFDPVVLPMPQVRHFDRSPHQAGLEAIRAIVARRIRKGLIEPDALEELLKETGGVLRDVFEVILVAAQAAKSLHAQGKQDKEAITPDNVRYGLNRRKNEYAKAITVLDLPEEWTLTPAELYARMRTLAGGPSRYLPSDAATMVLLNAKAIVEYDGETWFDLHPLVRELLPLFPE